MKDRLNRTPQFNIAQILALTTLVALLVSLGVFFNWDDIPSMLLGMSQHGPIERRIIFIVVCLLLPTFAVGVLVWLVFRLPYLIVGYRQMRQDRRNHRDKLLMEVKRKADEIYQSGDST